MQFPGLILIEDFCHTSEDLHKISRWPYPSDEAAHRGWTALMVDLLYEDHIESLRLPSA